MPNKYKTCLLTLVVLLISITSAVAQHEHHHMHLDSSGMVMNSNKNNLPRDCQKISRDYAITVYAGTEYAKDYPGTVFGLSQHETRVEPCSRITLTFVNKDSIRHQWMLHGLPRTIYPQGMFHIEAAGGKSQTGTFIVPSDNRTYLVHCDMAQHMEKGMKAQLVVGQGSGDLWSIPGVSKHFDRPIYLTKGNKIWLFITALASLGLAALLFAFVKKI